MSFAITKRSAAPGVADERSECSTSASIPVFEHFFNIHFDHKTAAQARTANSHNFHCYPLFRVEYVPITLTRNVVKIGLKIKSEAVDNRFYLLQVFA
jgi:hypothetical protein